MFDKPETLSDLEEARIHFVCVKDYIVALVSHNAELASEDIEAYNSALSALRREESRQKSE